MSGHFRAPGAAVMTVVLCSGDSNTHGTVPMSAPGCLVRPPPGGCRPDVMAAAAGREHRVNDAGWAGRTTMQEDLVEGGARNGLAAPCGHVPLDRVGIASDTNGLTHRHSVTASETARLVPCARSALPGVDVILLAPAAVRQTGCLAAVLAGGHRDVSAHADFGTGKARVVAEGPA